MGRIVEIGSGIVDGRVVSEPSRAELADIVMNRKQLVLLKGAFSDETMRLVRSTVKAWGDGVAAADVDDFRGNYHRRRAMVSRLQQAPHVFHDYNFNRIDDVAGDMSIPLLSLFEPLRELYNSLTGHQTEFGVPDQGPYVHPQVIHYPSGGGFFGRHWHNLEPQKLGFIVSMSKRGRDFRNGGTCFVIDGEVVDTEQYQDVGDILIWRYDHDHWVTQSDLQDKFDWNSDSGRWVATFAYFDPAG